MKDSEYAEAVKFDAEGLRETLRYGVANLVQKGLADAKVDLRSYLLHGLDNADDDELDQVKAALDKCERALAALVEFAVTP